MSPCVKGHKLKHEVHGLMHQAHRDQQYFIKAKKSINQEVNYISCVKKKRIIFLLVATKHEHSFWIVDKFFKFDF